MNHYIEVSPDVALQLAREMRSSQTHDELMIAAYRVTTELAKGNNNAHCFVRINDKLRCRIGALATAEG